MSQNSLVAVGDAAPDFDAPGSGREPSPALADFKGQTVVLYFYPKANTSGCTTQACGVRDRRADYERAGATVLGVSPDPVKEVKKFHERQGLNFTLLADEDHSVCDAYGTWQEKSMYGRRYWGATRSTFIIGPDGVVQDVLEKARPATHDDEVLGRLG